MSKILLIPDIHGRDFWKKAKDFEGEIVFLGDYLDPYRFEFDKKEIRFRTGLAIDSLILFTDMGYSFSKTMTAIMMVISLFMVMYSIIVYLTSNPVAGWTTTVLFLSVAFFGLFGILTVIIKYLQLLVDLVFKRKNYMYEDIEKITD